MINLWPNNFSNLHTYCLDSLLTNSNQLNSVEYLFLMNGNQRKDLM